MSNGTASQRAAHEPCHGMQEEHEERVDDEENHRDHGTGEVAQLR